MKKRLWMLFLLMLSLCFTACSKDDAHETTKASVNVTVTNVSDTGEAETETTISNNPGFTYRTDIRYVERCHLQWLSEEGIIYDGEDNLVHLITIDEGDDVVPCYNINCFHLRVPMTGSDSTCTAAHYHARVNKTAYYNDRFYMFATKDNRTHSIYEVNTDGSGRRFVAALPFYTQLTNGVIFKDDKVYYNAMIPKVESSSDVAGAVLTTYTTRLVEVSLDDGSYRFITEEFNDTMNRISIKGDTMYIKVIQRSTDGGLRLDMLDLETLEMKPVITRAEWHGGLRYVDPYDEDSYFFWDKNTYEIGLRNIDGSLEKILLRGEIGETFLPANATGDGIFYTRTLDYGNEPAGTYFLDLNTGKVTNLTEVAAKYKLEYYDEYYDAFISNGGDYIHWSMWSKELIFEEAAQEG